LLTQALIILVSGSFIVWGFSWLVAPTPRVTGKFRSTGLVPHSTIAKGSEVETQQLCVIVRSMASQRHTLPALLFSLYSDTATRSQVRVVVLDTDTSGKPAFSGLDAIINAVNVIIGFKGIVSTQRVQEKILKTQFPRLSTPDYGYILTDFVLEDIIAAFARNSHWNASLSRQPHVVNPIPQLSQIGWTCEFVLATNGDNVYTAEFLAEIFAALRPNGASMSATHWWG
jgi:hypothetical protein